MRKHELCWTVGEVVLEKSEANSSSGGGHKFDVEDLADLNESKLDIVVFVTSVGVFECIWPAASSKIDPGCPIERRL